MKWGVLAALSALVAVAAATVMAASVDDPMLAHQWGLQRVQAPAAWDVATGSGVTIAILDTGIAEPPDLAGKVVGRITYTGLPGDVNGHGTAMASIAAAVTNNGLGMAGVGFEATLLDVKVMRDDGSGPPTMLPIVDGIRWAADHGAKVINLSFGMYVAVPEIDAAVDYAWARGALVVASAGNVATAMPFYPAAYPPVLAVGATDNTDALALFSNRGPWVDANAPGVGILQAEIDGTYTFGAGTSQAAAVVSGVAALLFATLPDVNGDGRVNDEVRACIEQAADVVNGVRRVNAARAVSCTPVLPVPTPTGTPTPTPATPSPTPCHGRRCR